ncbi:MAG: helix-turn-helix domain-containing protein [Cellulophaga sp.]
MELYKLNDKIYPCSTTVTMSYIGGKWKTVILWYLAISPHRYSELRKKLMMVSERTLSLQLKQLAEDGLVNRKVYTKKAPMKVEYSLTKFGESVIPLLKVLSDWGEKVVEEKGEVVHT